MATVEWWDAVWYQDILGGGGRLTLFLTGVGFGTAVGLTAWPVGQNDPVLAVENLRVTTSDEVWFDLVNTGPGGSVVEGTNLAFSFITQ